ncbi:MAG TPA: PilZ domain-containing protein [Gemmataceae bacterium]|nr:PilZ domain-containing protein [Gemmataceae bacterium]
MTDLQLVANAVVRRARRQGWVRPSEIREELQQTRLPETDWKKVVNLSGPLLRYRRGRYYYEARTATPLQSEEHRRRSIQQAVRQLVRHYKKSHAQIERRQQGRTDFVQPVTVQAEDRRQYTLLSRDLSEAGIRLIGTRSLLGQKVRVQLDRGAGERPITFVVRILWTCTVGDGLFENGGTFLEMVG